MLSVFDYNNAGVYNASGNHDAVIAPSSYLVEEFHPDTFRVLRLLQPAIQPTASEHGVEHSNPTKTR
jgi:hypothetical protein